MCKFELILCNGKLRHGCEIIGQWPGDEFSEFLRGLGLARTLEYYVASFLYNFIYIFYFYTYWIYDSLVTLIFYYLFNCHTLIKFDNRFWGLWSLIVNRSGVWSFKFDEFYDKGFAMKGLELSIERRAQQLYNTKRQQFNNYYRRHLLS